jgi:hypothetical protein
MKNIKVSVDDDCRPLLSMDPGSRVIGLQQRGLFHRRLQVTGYEPGDHQSRCSLSALSRVSRRVGGMVSRQRWVHQHLLLKLRSILVLLGLPASQQALPKET